MVNKIPLPGPLCFLSPGWSLLFQLTAWLQSVFDRHGHAYCQNETLRLSEGTLLSNNGISASDQAAIAMLSAGVRAGFLCVFVCVKWMIWREDTKLFLHLSLGLDAALKVKVQTLESRVVNNVERTVGSKQTHATPSHGEGARLSRRLDPLFTGSVLISFSWMTQYMSQDRHKVLVPLLL